MGSVRNSNGSQGARTVSKAKDSVQTATAVRNCPRNIRKVIPRKSVQSWLNSQSVPRIRGRQGIWPKQEACPDCGGKLKRLGEDVSEILERVPEHFKVIREVRPKLACANCDKIVQAEAPSHPIAGGMAGPGLLAHVLVSKYGDDLPLYRQQEIYAREGVELERSTMASWVGAASRLLEPLSPLQPCGSPTRPIFHSIPKTSYDIGLKSPIADFLSTMGKTVFGFLAIEITGVRIYHLHPENFLGSWDGIPPSPPLLWNQWVRASYLADVRKPGETKKPSCPSRRL